MGNFKYIKIKTDNEYIVTEVPLKKDNIYFLSGEENYWLVSPGKSEDLQSIFIEREIIGIGWDKISINDLNKLNRNELKKLMESKYFFLSKKYKEKKVFDRYISTSVNKMNRFLRDIKLGDIIVLKDKGSNLIYFGKVISEAEDYLNKDLFLDNVSGYCNKIRKVKWFVSRNRDDVGAELKLVLRSRHAISNLSNIKVQDEIDREMFSYYYKGQNLHIVFQIETNKNISQDEFLEFQNIINSLKKDVVGSSIENNFNVKINIQSPGPVEFFGDPEIIKYIFYAVTGVSEALLFSKFLKVKEKLKIENPKQENSEIEERFKEGN